MEFIDLKSQYNKIADRLQERLSRLMRDASFIFGRETYELEALLAAHAGTRHCVSCSSGTDALLMPLMAWGVGEGDAVFVPAFTFFATAEAVSLAGATPVFVDLEPGTFNIDVEKLPMAIDAVRAGGRLRPMGVVAVDMFGHPARNVEIEQLARGAGLFFLEDAAQGFGGKVGSRAACSFGDAAATSFFPAKPLGCYGDGGAVFTDDDGLAEKLRSIRVHGQGSEKYENVRIGLNARLDNLQAAVLLEKMLIFQWEAAAKNEVAERYGERLRGIVGTPQVLDGYASAWAQYSLLARDKEERQAILESLRDNGVPSAVYYKTPLHKQPVYAGNDLFGMDFSVSEDICERVFSVPMHAYLSEADIDLVARAITSAVK
jgi:dTDP-4-amino-4,6-dideoxygalactose transaminase